MAGGSGATLIVNFGDGVAYQTGNIRLQAGYVQIPTATGDPTDAVAGIPTGAMYFNTSDNTLRVYNGGWKKVTLV